MADFRVLYDGNLYIEALVESVTWSGDVAQPYRTLRLTMADAKRSVDIDVGKEIRFYYDGVGLFRGIIFDYSVDHRGRLAITAYDENVYLTKNTDTRKFVGMTAAAIVRELCKAFDIPAGDIAATGYVIPKLILRNMTLWDMIVTALTQTRKQNGRKFYVYASNGKLNMREKKDAVVRWRLENGVNILGANRSRSIEDTRTAVKVIGGDDKKPLTATATDSAMTRQYGLMQHVELADSDMKQSALTQLANQRLKDLAKVSEDVTVEALGLTDVIAGTAVYAYENMTQLAGGFYVNADTHTFSGGVHRMEVTLSKTDDLPQIEYEGGGE